MSETTTPENGADGALETGAGIKDFDAEALAKLVAAADDEQLAQGMADPEGRKAALDDIFRRMADHIEPEKASSTTAVVHFKILDRPEGGYDHYEVVLENGTVDVSDEPSRDPRVTLRIGPVDFIKLVSGNANGPMLFMSGKLKIEGDLMFAATMTSLFRIPKAA
jgi:putative sterol carrier protein